MSQSAGLALISEVLGLTPEELGPSVGHLSTVAAVARECRELMVGATGAQTLDPAVSRRWLLQATVRLDGRDLHPGDALADPRQARLRGDASGGGLARLLRRIADVVRRYPAPDSRHRALPWSSPGRPRDPRMGLTPCRPAPA